MFARSIVNDKSPSSFRVFFYTKVDFCIARTAPEPLNHLAAGWIGPILSDIGAPALRTRGGPSA